MVYKLTLSRQEKKKLLRVKWLVLAAAVLGAGAVIWLAWIRPIQKEATVNSFAACAKAGNPIQESYPEVCLTKDGKRFTNPKQSQAHQANLTSGNKLAPPSNPALLKLDIEEWGVRVPLTDQTFDLGYTYIGEAGNQRVLFTYKRLLQIDACKDNIGLTLTRSALEHQAPFTPANPAPTAKVGNNFYYVAYAGSPCYDAKNAEQAALVKDIAGEQSLTQATTGLLTKLTLIPKE